MKNVTTAKTATLTLAQQIQIQVAAAFCILGAIAVQFCITVLTQL